MHKRALWIVPGMLLLLCAAADADPIDEALEKISRWARDGGASPDLTTDPWIVVDELCARGDVDLALRYAAALEGPAFERLPAYVEERGSPPESPAARETLTEAIRFVQQQKLQEAFEMLSSISVDEASGVTWVRVQVSRGNLLGKIREYAAAAGTFQTAADAAASIGWAMEESYSCDQAARSLYAHRDFRGALAMWRRHRDLCIRLADPAALGRANLTLGNVLIDLDLPDEARDSLRKAREHFVEAGDALGAARALGLTADLESRRGSAAAAKQAADQALREFRLVGNGRGEQVTLVLIGHLQRREGRLAAARASFQAAYEWLAARKDVAGLLGVLSALGEVEYDLGNLSEAYGHHEQALEIARQAKDRQAVAANLSLLARIDRSVGDAPRADARLQEATVLLEAIGASTGLAVALRETAEVRAYFGDLDGALELAWRVHALSQATANPALGRAALFDAATFQLRMRRFADVESTLERIEAHGEGASTASRVATFRARVAIDQGKPRLAVNLLRPIYEETRSRYPDGEPVLAVELAEAERQVGNHDAAIRLARDNVAVLQEYLTGLGYEIASAARNDFHFIFRTGALAAVAARDPEALCFFMESGRSGALLAALRGGRAIRSATMPEDLREQEAHALQRQADALKSYRDVARRGRRKELRAAREELRAARTHVREVIDRIQRTAQRGADLLYPEPDDLEQIRSRLQAKDAYIAFSLFEGDACALVVTPTKTHVIDLGTHDFDAADVVPPSDGKKAYDLAAMRAFFVDPLPLEDGVRRILLSPDRWLAQIPFVLLFGERTLAYVPSGTVLGHLSEEAAHKGDGVFAMANPMADGYSSLQETAEEARAIGDTVLLREHATEAGLRDALAREDRWRAIHIACHGAFDPNETLASGLALTPSGGDDGILTGREMFRLDVNADLVTLSACEMGRGRVMRAEGIEGMTRAFLFAGAPRVLSALWKVDDRATRELMVKFYHLWPSRPAAEALRQAQDHVRAQPGWEHPFYWAAWQLWGLPD